MDEGPLFQPFSRTAATAAETWRGAASCTTFRFRDHGHARRRHRGAHDLATLGARRRKVGAAVAADGAILGAGHLAAYRAHHRAGRVRLVRRDVRVLGRALDLCLRGVTAAAPSSPPGRGHRRGCRFLRCSSVDRDLPRFSRRVPHLANDICARTRGQRARGIHRLRLGAATGLAAAWCRGPMRGLRGAVDLTPAHGSDPVAASPALGQWALRRRRHRQLRLCASLRTLHASGCDRSESRPRHGGQPGRRWRARSLARRQSTRARPDLPQCSATEHHFHRGREPAEQTHVGVWLQQRHHAAAQTVGRRRRQIRRRLRQGDGQLLGDQSVLAQHDDRGCTPLDLPSSYTLIRCSGTTPKPLAIKPRSLPRKVTPGTTWRASSSTKAWTTFSPWRPLATRWRTPRAWTTR